MAKDQDGPTANDAPKQTTTAAPKESILSSKTAASAVASIAGAALGLIDPILGVVGAGLAPAATIALQDLAGSIRRRGSLRLTVVAAAAEEAAKKDLPDLLQLADDDPTKTEIAERVFRIASQPGSDKKMRALGRALALGLLAKDDRAVDEMSLMLRAVQDLEDAHIKILEFLHKHGDRYAGIVDHKLAELFPNGVKIIYPVLKTLERHGLAGPLKGHLVESPDAEVTWAIWDFGILFLEQLFRVGTAPHDEQDTTESRQ